MNNGLKVNSIHELLMQKKIFWSTNYPKQTEFEGAITAKR